jgi:hypothetical protein
VVANKCKSEGEKVTMSFYQHSVHKKMGRASYGQVLQSSSDSKADSREEGVKLSENSNKQESKSQTKQRQNSKVVPSL